MVRWMTLVCSALLGGCAASNIAPGYALNQTSGAGVATGTITYNGGYGAYRLHIAAKQGDKSYIVEHGSAQTLNPVRIFKPEEPDKDLGLRGSPFAIELPKGAYVIRSWQVSQGPSNVWSTVPIDIEFTIEAGKAIYLGNFDFQETKRFGRAIAAATVTLTDHVERDGPILAKRFPALSNTPITQSLQQGTSITNVGGSSSGRISIPMFVPVMR